MGQHFEASHSLAGKLLLALPGMGDPRFERSVNAVCVHDAEGALGIGIGQLRDDVTFHDVLLQLDLDPGVAPDAPVHNGGPVEPGRGFVLHSPDWTSDGTMRVSDSLALSASFDVLRAIAAGEGPQHWLFALGYAGWGPGQLDDEMHHHGWHVVDIHEDIIFTAPTEARWDAVWRAEGIEPALLSSQTGQA